MKNWLPLFLISLSFVLHSQTLREFSPSKTNKFTDTESKLVLTAKNSVHFLNRNVDDFIDAKRVELKGIKDPEVLENIAKRVLIMNKLEELTFNNCDLFFLSFEFGSLSTLKKFSVLNTSFYNPNDIVYALRNNPALIVLTLSVEEATSVPDSIHLLTALKQLSVINSEKPRKNTKAFNSNFTYVTASGERNNIAFDQLGFEEPAVAEISYEPVKSSAPVTENFSFSNNIVKPLFPGIKINDTLYYLESREESIVDYESGTSLYVPKNAFVTANGKDYNGPVTLFYREFRDPIDQVLAGIPMTEHENGKENVFVSAGMYELWAFNDKAEKLQLKQDKNITVNFKPTTDTGTYNFYNLDTNTGKWNSSAQSVNLTKNFKDSYATSFRAFLAERDKLMRQFPDHTKFEDRFSDANYAGIIHKKNYNYYKDSTAYSLKGPRPWIYNKRNSIFNKHRVRSKYKFTSARLTKDDQLVFRYVTRQNLDYGMGQNLRALEDKQLMYAGNISKEEFKKKYYKTLFTDVRMEDNGSYLTLKLKTQNGVEELPFNIVEYDHDKKEFITKTKTEHGIARHFKLRVKVDNKVYDKRNKRSNNRPVYDHIYGVEKSLASKMAYDKVKKDLNETERSFNYERYVKMADSVEIRWRFNSTQISQTFNKSLDTIVAKTNSILINSRLGFNNIDCYLHQGLVQDLYVNYVSPEKKPVKTDYTTTIIKGINTSINNYNYDGAAHIATRYIEGKEFMILRLDPEGYVQFDTFKRREVKGGSVDLPLTNQVSIKNKSSDEIKKLMGL
mgnify:CR=1 FL=1